MTGTSIHGPVRRSLVLVIDDSQTFRAAIAQALRSAGYDVAGAATGSEGLRAAARLRPDVMVVDRVLPDLDGTAVIRNIRLDPALRRTPCLLVTADDDPAVEFTALETGADAYVRKDEDISILLARVASLGRDAPRAPDAAPARARRRLLLIPAGDGAAAMAPPPSGYDAVRASGVDGALAALGAQTIDCAVIVGGRITDALDAITAIRQTARERHVPILVLGHSDNAADAADALAGGADDYASLDGGPALYHARLRALIRRKEVEAEDRRVTEELLTREGEAAAARVRAEMAEDESEFKSRFLAIMSHELRTPLNAILGFTQLLERGVGGELADGQRKHLEGVVRSAQHLLALVNDVLDLSTIRAGKLTLRGEAVQLGDVAETTRMTASAIAAQRGVTLSVDVPPSLPPIHGDARRIQQILYNLLSNGLKFTAAGGSVSLSASLDGDFVKLMVRDTGVGIRHEDFDRLFKDFERLDHGRSQQADGTGLGLSLTKHLVDLHGGRIEVDSEVGAGTTFTVWLPTAAAPAT